RRSVAAVVPGSRLVVAQRNLRGYRGLTLDAFGALLRGGPTHFPLVLRRLVSASGAEPDKTASNRWIDAIKKQFEAKPFVPFRDAHRAAVTALFAQYRISADLDETIDEAFDEYRHAKAYPEVRSVLHELEREVALAVVSNMDTKMLLEALQDNDLSFTFIVTSEEEQQYKPAAGIFERAIRYLGLPPAHVLHVGDSATNDVDGASSAGMGSLRIDRSSRKGRRLPDSLNIVHDLREVQKFVRQSWE
ncbi:MAG: HAD family hydrolase, partial [Thermoplasmata archaeon]|nr:HAD family hydrolase [Thermoplasmata archaeon]